MGPARSRGRDRGPWPSSVLRNRAADVVAQIGGEPAAIVVLVVPLVDPGRVEDASVQNAIAELIAVAIRAEEEQGIEGHIQLGKCGVLTKLSILRGDLLCRPHQSRAVVGRN